MSDYWIYEDIPTHMATVHRGDCRYCNHGAGMGRGRNEHDNWWLGPFESADVARSAPIRSNTTLHVCGASPCRDDIALAAVG
jgi:F-type H+/Na+-transporting ATPase subunit beta